MPDEGADCLFCRMASGAIPVARLLDDDHCFVIRDIHPRAPTHLLVIPKRHIADARRITAADGDLLACLFAAATATARTEGLLESGYRLAFNVGEAAGMSISHLHLHLLGGRRLGPEG